MFILLSLLLYGIAEAKAKTPRLYFHVTLTPTIYDLHRPAPRVLKTPEEKENHPEVSKPAPKPEKPISAKPIPTKAVTPPKNKPVAKKVTDAGHYSVEEVKALIIQYSQQYHINSALPLRIANAESGYRYDAVNPASGACGVMQYLPSTWRNTPEGKSGLSCKNADANIRAGVRHISVHGTAPWNASKHVWGK